MQVQKEQNTVSAENYSLFPLHTKLFLHLAWAEWTFRKVQNHPEGLRTDIIYIDKKETYEEE